MAKFVFKLEALLKQRKRAEQDRQRALAERQAVLIEHQNAFARAEEALRQASEDLRNNHLVGVIDLGYLAAHRRFLGSMQRQGVAIAEKVAAATVKVDEARRQLLEAVKQRKAIDRLREKQLERWKIDQEKREIAAADEIGMQISYANLRESETAR